MLQYQQFYPNFAFTAQAQMSAQWKWYMVSYYENTLNPMKLLVCGPHLEKLRIGVILEKGLGNTIEETFHSFITEKSGLKWLTLFHYLPMSGLP